MSEDNKSGKERRLVRKWSLLLKESHVVLSRRTEPGHLREFRWNGPRKRVIHNVCLSFRKYG